MSISDYIGSSLDGPISAVRRLTIAIAVAAGSAVGAVFFGLSAALLALEPLVGPIYARLLIAALFIFIGGAAVLLPRLFHTPSVVERARSEADSLTRDQKIAMVIEAVMMGFALSSRGKSAQKHD
jgi:hypothetical protein